MPDFTVITWNVLAQAYVKPDRYPHSRPEDLAGPTRRARILEHLQRRDPDVLCLQEVEPDLLDDLATALPDHTAQHAPRHRGPDGCAVLFRRDAFRLVHHETLHFDADGKDHPAAIVQLAHHDRRLGLVSTHLRWQRRDTPAEQHVGRDQLLQILDWIEPQPDPAWIVAGDFNAWSESPVVEAALARGYRLSCRSQRPWDTINIHGRRRKIDYLLYTPATLAPHPAALPRLERTTPMPSPVHPSDHLPVEVRYTWR